jgi:predicted DCC family thiol-disulfide oxidoreductase YuxK
MDEKLATVDLEQLKSKNILVFDGDCLLCNKLIQFILRKDKRKKIHLVTLQSNLGKSILIKYKFKPDDYSTVMFIKNEVLYTKSTAVIEILTHLNRVYKMALCLLIIPKFIRDFVYSIVAKNRHRFFQNKSCLLMNNETKERILQ